MKKEILDANCIILTRSCKEFIQLNLPQIQILHSDFLHEKKTKHYRILPFFSNIADIEFKPRYAVNASRLLPTPLSVNSTQQYNIN